MPAEAPDPGPTRAYSAERQPGELPTRAGGARVAGPPSLESGGVFGRYRLTRSLGAGGMGVVWQAWDEELQRTVALKMMREGEWGGPDSGARFEREARLAARLRHPGVVRVHDVGALQGRRYLTMDFIEGRTLDAVLAEGRQARVADPACTPARLRQEVALLADAVEAVAYAHEQGVIHRDLKPANVMVDRDGRAVVMDFGLAKEVLLEPEEGDGAGRARMTQTGQVLGTPAYMSPEQAAGDAAAVGPRSDVWALGVILYEILTGNLPFEGRQTWDVFRAIEREEPSAPRSVRPGLPVDLEAVCLRALEKESGRRYAGVRELGEELRRWLRGEPVLARSPSAALRLWRWLVRWRAVAIPAAAAVLVALTFGSYVLGTRMATARLKAAWLREGLEHQAAGRMLKALQAFERASGIDPGDANLRRLREEASARLAAERERMESETRAARAREAAAAVYHLAAVELHRLRLRSYRRDWRLTDRERAEYERLARSCAEEMERSGESPDGWWVVGRVRQVSGDGPAALEAYDRGLALDPAHGPCLLEKARLWIERSVLERFTSRAASTRLQRARERVDAALALVDSAVKGGRTGEMDLDLARGWALVVGKADAREYCAAMLDKWEGRDLAEEFLLIRGLAHPEGLEGDAGAALERRPGFADALFWRGVGRMTRGDFDGALEDLKRALEIDPLRPDAWFVQANLLQERGDSEGSLDALERAISLNPRHVESLLNRGRLRLLARSPVEAIADLNRALELEPSLVAPRLTLAVARYEQGDFEAAEAELARAMRVDPSDPAPWVQRGVMRLRRGEDAGAEGDFTEAIRIDPEHSPAYAGRANLRRRRGDVPGALKDLDTVLAANPRDWVARLDRAAIRAEAGDAEGAIADLDAAVLAAPGEPEPVYRRALFRRAAKDPAAAREDCDRAIAAAPSFALAYILRGALREETGDPEGALADYGRAAVLRPREANGWYNRGRLRHQRRDLAAAIEDYTKALECAPGDARTWTDRAAARQMSGDPRGAIEDADRALALEPGRADALRYRGAGKLGIGDLRGAIEDLLRAVETGGANREAFNILGVAYMQLGDAGAARESFDRAIESDPTFAPAWSNRGRLLCDLGDVAGGAADLERALTLAPDHPAARFNRSRLRRMTGDREGALRDLDHALHSAPGLLEALLSRSEIRYEQGDWQGAWEDADRAVSAAPKDPQAPALRGQAREALGDLDGALVDLDSAVLLDPENAPLRFRRAQLLERLAGAAPATARERLSAALRDAEAALAAASPDWPQRETVRREVERLRARLEALGR